MRTEEETADHEEGGLDEGPESIDTHGLVQTAWAAFGHAMQGVGAGVPDWDELEDEYLIPFQTAVLAARDGIISSADRPVTVTHLTEITLAAYLITGLSEQEPASVPHNMRLPWEAVVRHVAGVLEMDPDDLGELPGRESAWAEWASNRREDRGEANE